MQVDSYLLRVRCVDRRSSFVHLPERVASAVGSRCGGSSAIICRLEWHSPPSSDSASERRTSSEAAARGGLAASTGRPCRGSRNRRRPRGVAYVAWRGGVSGGGGDAADASSSSLSASAEDESDGGGALDVPRALAAALGLVVDDERQEGKVAGVPTMARVTVLDGVPRAARVCVAPASVDDWATLLPHAAALEASLLRQVSARRGARSLARSRSLSLCTYTHLRA